MGGWGGGCGGRGGQSVPGSLSPGTESPPEEESREVIVSHLCGRTPPIKDKMEWRW